VEKETVSRGQVSTSSSNGKMWTITIYQFLECFQFSTFIMIGDVTGHNGYLRTCCASKLRWPTDLPAKCGGHRGVVTKKSSSQMCEAW